MKRHHPRSTLFPYTTLFRSTCRHRRAHGRAELRRDEERRRGGRGGRDHGRGPDARRVLPPQTTDAARFQDAVPRDRKSTRLNSSHMSISYAVFCLKKKTLYVELINYNGKLTIRSVRYYLLLSVFRFLSFRFQKLTPLRHALHSLRLHFSLRDFFRL